MTPHPTTRHSTHTADADRVHVRQEDATDGVFSVRMPIATTGEVRNEGDEPLTRAELVGMAEQLQERDIPVFLDHGQNTSVSGSRYSAVGKVGEWRDAAVERAGEESQLVASAVMMDPETLTPEAGPVRAALASIKEQVERGFSLSSSIGWQPDENAPGGQDLMEASIVGIPADPATASDADTALVARAAVDAGADPDALVQEVRAALDHEDDGDTRQVYEVGDTDVEITPPDYMVNAAEEALAAKEEYDDLSDCGTGVGEDRARQIINDEVGPDVVEEIAAYLTSHAEDVSADGTPDTWSEETWTDGCGPVQYALWGGIGTGTSREWAQYRANAVAEARDEELPYPELQNDMTDTDSTDEPTDEQTPDGERMPADVSEDDLLTFTATHYDGMDEGDLAEAADAADASYVGALDMEETADLVSTATGAEYDACMDAMEDLAGMEENEHGDTEDDEDEEDDGEMQSADADSESDADAGERDADTDATDSDNESDTDAVSELRAEIADLREQITDATPADPTPDEGDDDAGERDADTDATDSDEDDEQTAATAGPNWRN